MIFADKASHRFRYAQSAFAMNGKWHLLRIAAYNGSMKQFLIAVGAVALGLTVTACATKKYVAQTVAKSVDPVASRVSATESKNSDQDKQIAATSKQVEEVERDLSPAKERIDDVDAKAGAAGTAAAQAGTRADNAQRSADDAKGAAQTAQQGVQRAEQRTEQVARNVDALVKMKLVTSATALFATGQSKISAEAKQAIAGLARQASGNERYMIEVQGYTDKTGDAVTNDRLSQARAEAVARELTNENKIPVRNISMIGSGYANPVGDDKTRDGRQQNRRVELRLFVPEATSAAGR